MIYPMRSSGIISVSRKAKNKKIRLKRKQTKMRLRQLKREEKRMERRQRANRKREKEGGLGELPMVPMEVEIGENERIVEIPWKCPLTKFVQRVFISNGKRGKSVKTWEVSPLAVSDVKCVVREERWVPRLGKYHSFNLVGESGFEEEIVQEVIVKKVTHETGSSGPREMYIVDGDKILMDLD